MTQRLLIVGAGGHGKVSAEVAMMMNYYREIVFLDDNVSCGSTVLDLPVVGSTAELVKLLREDDGLFVAVGDNYKRRELLRRIRAQGLPVATLCDPSAIVSHFATIAEGTLVMPRVVVNAGARIGAGCILNTGAIVEHDCDVGNFAHLSPAVCIGGGVRVGDTAHLGLGAKVLPRLSIGSGTVVGAGSVVTRDLPSNVVAVGVPARIIRYADSTIQPEYYRAGEARVSGGLVQAESLPRQQAG